MKIQRTRNATRNIFFGIIYRIIVTGCPFIIRTALLYWLGVEYVGLSNLFTSLLSFLSLAELGIGNAMVYAMYKPIADEDHDRICALLNLYRHLYRIIGVVILSIGLLLFPFIKYFVKDTPPADVSLYVLYGIYLFNTVISYFLFAYKQSILMGYQRQDIISKRSMILQMAMYLAQVVLLYFFRNYYIFVLVLPLCTIATNFANSIIVDRLYPQYKCRGEVPLDTKNEIRKNVFALVGGKLSNTVLHSSDNVVLSMFIGLSAVAIYGNYYYILNAVAGFTAVVYASLTAGLGNSIVTESVDKNHNDFMVLSFVNAWIVGWCSICLLCLFQPFMELWVGKDLLYHFSMVILFALYFYLYQINKIVLTYKDAGGLWWQDRYRPYVVMGTNLLLNITSIQFIGVYGVILSTIVSLIISIPWSTWVIFKFLFKRGSGHYTMKLAKYTAISLVACLITYYVCSLVQGELAIALILRFMICAVVPNVIFVMLNLRDQYFQTGIKRLFGMVKRKIAKK